MDDPEDSNKESHQDPEQIEEYLQIVEKFMRMLREKFTITPEISDLMISVYRAIDNENYPEATRHLEAILKNLKETSKRFKDFDLDGVLAAFMKR